MAEARIALVTGAARGLGLAIARGLARRGQRVHLSARDAGRAARAAQALTAEGLEVRPLALDVADAASIAAAVAHLTRTEGRLDVLVNNAGVLLDEPHDALSVPLDVLRTTLEVDLVGPWALLQACAPLLRRGRSPRVVNVSSTAGSLHDLAAGTQPGAWGPPAYCTAKAALNAFTVLAARALARDRVLVNACCPGWVRTDMGGPDATLSPEEGADTPLWLTDLPDDGPTGGFFSERAPHPW